MQKWYCYVYTSEYQKTDRGHNGCVGEDLKESVNLVLGEPPYNTCRKSNNYNKNYDNLTHKNTKRRSRKLLKTLFTRGGNSVIFCTNYHFGRQYELLSAVNDKKCT